MRRALLLLPLILVPVASAGAKPPNLALPYGLLVDHKGRVFIADAGRHQVLRYDGQRRRLVRVAGNGKAGIGEDGGPALRARLGEITSLAEDSTGTCTSLTSTTVSRGASSPEAASRLWHASQASSGSTSTQAAGTSRWPRSSEA
jgi:hypothetical protein